jgi:hypothetical protein
MQQMTVRWTEFKLRMILKEIPAKPVICPFSEKKLMVVWVVMLQVHRKHHYYGQICIITSIIVKKNLVEELQVQYQAFQFHYQVYCHQQQYTLHAISGE